MMSVAEPFHDPVDEEWRDAGVVLFSNHKPLDCVDCRATQG